MSKFQDSSDETCENIAVTGGISPASSLNIFCHGVGSLSWQIDNQIWTTFCCLPDKAARSRLTVRDPLYSSIFPVDTVERGPLKFVLDPDKRHPIRTVLPRGIFRRLTKRIIFGKFFTLASDLQSNAEGFQVAFFTYVCICILSFPSCHEYCNYHNPLSFVVPVFFFLGWMMTSSVKKRVERFCEFLTYLTNIVEEYRNTLAQNCWLYSCSENVE